MNLTAPTLTYQQLVSLARRLPLAERVRLVRGHSRAADSRAGRAGGAKTADPTGKTLRDGRRAGTGLI